MSQQRAQEDNCILAPIRTSVTSRTRAVIVPAVLSTGEVTLPVLCPVLAFHCNRDMEVLE